MRRALAAPALMVLGMFAHQAAMANPEPWQLNMPKGVTVTSNEVHDIHMIVLWICVAIGVVVFGLMFVAMFRFRKSKQDAIPGIITPGPKSASRTYRLHHGMRWV
jgi:cytochrome c oxidase subunit 2